MKKPPPLLVYTLLRLLAFLVPLAIMLVFFPPFREYWLLATLFAALIGVSISLIFLRAPLSEASRSIHELRQRRSTPTVDEDFEDSASDV